ncbi:hypothetical protein Q5P01_017729 [Channa striata]|uniref:Matrix Gla protein n=1 Tax=Channa striata TaxID=64152 RepID=A0AA88SDB7_CHASR|nr:hypothetical protein Q5P01_017729 [Channa striata]
MGQSENKPGFQQLSLHTVGSPRSDSSRAKCSEWVWSRRGRSTWAQTRAAKVRLRSSSALCFASYIEPKSQLQASGIEAEGYIPWENIHTEASFPDFSSVTDTGRHTSGRMRSLLRLAALCAVLSLCVCYDSHESSESAEDLFVSRHRANSFIPSRGSPLHFPSVMRATKSPVERRAEICEDFFPCRYYAYRHGYQQAFQRYFTRDGAQNQPQRPARARRS